MRRSCDQRGGGQEPLTEELFAFNATVAGAAERAVVLDEGAISTHVARTLSPHVMDLIETVAAVHVADRLVARPSTSRAGCSWSRHLRLRMGVREAAHWSRPDLTSQLETILTWLTDDRWRFEFVPRQTPARKAECVQFLFDRPPDGDVLALFSGGLDSVAGIIADVEAGTRPVALSVGSNGRMRGRQRSVLDEVSRSLGNGLAPLPVELHLRRTRSIEPSQRARGFAFLGLAGAAAVSLGLEQVHVYENGVGAINLPYTAAQTGAHGTHSMHPLTLRRMQTFLRSALGAEVTITNRSQFVTKAEMCARLASEHWRAIRRSQSCDTAFAMRSAVPESCGVCTSCLLRRQSLHGAALGHLDNPRDYRVDALDPAAWSRPDAYGLRAMVAQAAELSHAVSSSDPAAHLMSRFPDLAIWSGSLATDQRSQLLGEVTRLLTAYAAEWHAFPSEPVQRFLRSSGSAGSWEPAAHGTDDGGR